MPHPRLYETADRILLETQAHDGVPAATRRSQSNKEGCSLLELQGLLDHKVTHFFAVGV